MTHVRADLLATAIAVMDTDPRSRWLVEAVSGGDGRARLWRPGEGGFVPSSTEWIVIPPAGVQRTAALDPPLALAVSLSAGVLMPRPASWLGGVSAPAVFYGEDPEFLWANASATAEGALIWALSATPGTLRGASLRIYGFGRVALTTALLCKAVGADVEVCCRDREERCQARAQGFRTGDLDAVGPVDLALNTIPAPVISGPAAASLGRAAVLELASAPGGFTAEARQVLGSRLDGRPGLPGKVAPKASAEIWADALDRALMRHPSRLDARQREGDF